MQSSLVEFKYDIQSGSSCWCNFKDPEIKRQRMMSLLAWNERLSIF